VKKALLVLLVFSPFISITLLEGSALLLLLYWLLKERSFTGRLRWPLVLYALPSLLSTALYYPARLLRAAEESLLPFTYLTHLRPREALFTYRLFLKSLFLFFPLLTAVGLYRYQREGQLKPLWGGSFEAGYFFALFGTSFLFFAFTEKRKGLKALFFAGALFSFFMVLLSTRRSMMLAFALMSLALLWLLLKEKRLSLKLLLPFLAGTVLLSGGAYLYLSEKDPRFKALHQVLTGKRPLNERTLNVISSSRYRLFKEAVLLIKKDLKEKNFLPLLVGHGILTRERLLGASIGRYESFFVVSEFVERGLLGLLGILLVYWHYWRFFFSLRLSQRESLLLALPLGLHLLQTLFTYFWDAMLPYYFLLFKASEVLRDCREG